MCLWVFLWHLCWCLAVFVFCSVWLVLVYRQLFKTVSWHGMTMNKELTLSLPLVGRDRTGQGEAEAGQEQVAGAETDKWMDWTGLGWCPKHFCPSQHLLSQICPSPLHTHLPPAFLLPCLPYHALYLPRQAGTFPHSCSWTEMLAPDRETDRQEHAASTPPPPALHFFPSPYHHLCTLFTTPYPPWCHAILPTLPHPGHLCFLTGQDRTDRDWFGVGHERTGT